MACEILLLWPRVVFNLQISQETRVPYSPAYAIQESDESRYPNEVQYCISWEVYQISDILVDEVLYQIWLDILLMTFGFNPALVERSLSQYLRWALSIFGACQPVLDCYLSIMRNPCWSTDDPERISPSLPASESRPTASRRGKMPNHAPFARREVDSRT